MGELRGVKRDIWEGLSQAILTASGDTNFMICLVNYTTLEMHWLRFREWDLRTQINKHI
jgi:hypothetical protein